MSPGSQHEPKNGNPWRQVGVALSLVFVIPVAVAVGGLAGLWLDERLGTKPWLTLILVGVGFIGGMREVLRKLKKLNPSGKS